MTALQVALLGEPRLRCDGAEVACASKKALGLFCFLATSGTRRHARRELAQLFWGGAQPEAARASLRNALLRLPPALARCLDASRESVALTAPIQLDAARFTDLAAADDLPALHEAAALYRGEFLKGLEIDATAEFDDWVARQRARLHQLAQSVFDRLIERHRERARQDVARASLEREAAMAAARRWCELEPAAEAAHRWLIRLYLEAGRPEAALTQYETCRRELAVGTGRAPSLATRELVEALNVPLRATAANVPSEPVDAATAVLAKGLPSTSFFGRLEELAALQQLLQEPGCRLLTLHALGGMGKSRLASVLVNQIAAGFPQGAAWVALDTISSGAQIPLAIAQVLGIDLGRGEPGAALCAALRTQDRLLVLDNFEHLLANRAQRDGDAVEFVLALLREAPRVRILVTSREVLGVQEEWLYELPGLSYPREGEEPTAATRAALDLFAERARQAYATFSPQAEWPHMLRLVRLVEGLPLALELAAAWVRTVPCGDLVRAIENEARTLAAARHRNRPERQRSLDAVVRTSWSMLTREQQHALAPLCMFAGGFTQDAAGVVGQAPLRVLSALVDKSLVQRRADGRLGLHELVRQFLLGMLGRDAARLAQRRHTAYFTELLLRHRALLDGKDGLGAHMTLTAELPNLAAAASRWDLAKQADEVAEPWLVVQLGRGLQRLALPFADQVLALDDQLPPETRARVLIQRGVAHVTLGQREQADADLAQATALARKLKQPALLASALVHHALVGLLSDDVAAIEGRFAELDPLLAALDDPVLSTRAGFYRGALLESRGRDADARREFERTLALAEASGVSQQMQATLRTVTARVLIRGGEFDRAETLLRQAVTVHEQVGNSPRLAQALTAQATAWLWAHGKARAHEAARLAQRALALHEQCGHPPGISAASHTLGLAMQALGRHAEARKLYERAVRVQSPALQAEARRSLGLLILEQDGPVPAARAAIELVELALAHDLPTIRHDAVTLASAVLARAGSARPLVAGLLATLIAETDLSFEYRQAARSTRLELGDPDAAALAVDKVALLQLRVALTPLASS